MSILSNSERIKRAIEQVVDERLKSQTKDCFRVYKALLTAKGDTTMTVKILGNNAGSNDTMTIPFSSAVADAAVNSIVLVATTYDSWRNAVVWEKYNFKSPSGGGGDITQHDLNVLEAKINENIIENPSKTYLVWKGTTFPNSTQATFKAPANSVIDWGDGTVEKFNTASSTVNTHTYTDGIDYHLIAINGLTSIAATSFYNCADLVNITIGSNVTSIGSSAFNSCSGLTSIVIPYSVTSIGSSAFLNCANLKTITLSRTTPPTLQSTSLPTTIEKIIVPKSAINIYKTATNWSAYSSKIVYEVDSSDLTQTTNKTLTIKQNGTTLGTYDGSADTTVNIITSSSVVYRPIGNDYY